MKKILFHIAGFVSQSVNKIKNGKNIPLNRQSALIAVLVCALLVQGTVLGRNVYIDVFGECTDWGLSFPEEGKTPVGNSSVEFLRQYDAYFVNEAAKGKIYLTFDAGYENGYTETILDTLKEKNVKAAFFIVGHYVQSNPELVKRMLEEGHLVCNHTLDHPDMTSLGEREFTLQLTDMEKTFEETVGCPINKFYRPPSGKYNEDNLSWAKNAGYTTVLWSLAYADWDNEKQPTKATAFEKILPRLHDGCILLLHSTSKTNSLILGELIDNIRAKGYSFSTLDELGADS